MIDAKNVRIGYKVVRHSKNTLVSHNARFDVRYYIGKWTFPFDESGPLCVFSLLDDALRFSHSCGGSVFKCDYVKSSLRSVWRVCHKNKYNVVNVKRLPNGTKLADSVKLMGKEIFVK